MVITRLLDRRALMMLDWTLMILARVFFSLALIGCAVWMIQVFLLALIVAIPYFLAAGAIIFMVAVIRRWKSKPSNPCPPCPYGVY